MHSNLLSIISPLDAKNEDKKLTLALEKLEDIDFSMFHLFSQRVELASQHDIETEVSITELMVNNRSAFNHQRLRNILKWHNDKCNVLDLLVRYSVDNNNMDDAFCCYLWHFFAGLDCFDSQIGLISAFTVKGYTPHALHLLENLTECTKEDDPIFTLMCHDKRIELESQLIEGHRNVLDEQVCINLASSLFSTTDGSVPSNCCFVFRCIQVVLTSQFYKP